MLEVLKTIAETYDTGDKEVVYTKGKEFRSKEIVATPISAMLISSPTYIIYDESTKKKFLIVFGSKLARRSFFCYVPKLIKPDYATLADRLDDEEKTKIASLRFREDISKELINITEFQLSKGNELIQIDKDVFTLFNTYKVYNEELSETLNSKYPLSKLVREHLQWKALKLAGAYSIMKCHDSVTAEDYIDAINTCELLDQDMSVFEAELVKEPYEVFASYMQDQAYEGKSSISLHDLRKLKHIPMSGNPKQKMNELVHLAASYDPDAVYKVVNDHIHYEAIVKTDTIGVSYLAVDNSEIATVHATTYDTDTAKKKALEIAKGRIASGTASGFTYEETSFSNLSTILESDFAFSAYYFRDGIRGKDNIVGGAKWIVLDIDDSDVTAEEASFMLQDINHHIALSSDPDNAFKFRIIIELDAMITVNAIVFKHFLAAVANHLSFTIDPVPQSQIFFSYANRQVLSVTDAEPLPTRDILMIAHEKTNDPTPLAEKKITNSQKQALLDDELTTFSYCFEAKPGEGSRSMIRMARHAIDLGLDKEQTIDLVHRANNYWVDHMDEDRLQNTVITQILRW